MVVKTFRGLMADLTQDRLSLSSIKGKLGYKIIKFEIISEKPGVTTVMHVVKIYKDEQTTIDAEINFDDSALMGVAIWHKHPSPTYALTATVIFDQEIVNQDIYITHKDSDIDESCNYYIELEQFPLASDEATVATLKDIKLNA
jgi:hypothetical protein